MIGSFINKRHKKDSGGFTLIELSIVLLITGILMVSLLQAYSIYVIGQRMEQTKDNMNVSRAAISSFSPIRLPCPADRSLGPTNANYGKEVCNLALIPVCDATLTQGICKTVGSRDATGTTENSPPDTIINNTGNDTIIIGGVPLKDTTGANIAGIHGFNLLDGWGRKLTYAVSYSLAKTTKTTGIQDYKYGVINAVDENGNKTAGVTGTGTEGNAQYAIISHGANGGGAFDLYGGLYAPCPAAPARERENCNNDFTFVQGLGDSLDLDDYAYFYLETNGDIWYQMPDGAGNPSGHINNLNTSNVGVKTTAPTVKLDVNGDITADTVRADQFCNKAGTSCFPTSFFGNVHVCPVGQVMLGYSNSAPICANPDLTLPVGYTGVDCHSLGSTYWVKGMLSNGCVICSNGLADITLPNAAPCI